MKKTLLLLLTLNILCFNLLSQELEAFSTNKKAELEQTLIAKSKQISSLQADFVQEKISDLVKEKSISRGILEFKKPDFLRWEYIFPNAITLISNGKEIYLLDAKGEKRDAKNFRQLGNFIISAIGGEGLTDNKNFSVEYFKIHDDNRLILLRLTPVNKRLKSYYAKIEMKIEIANGLAHEIIMYETSGDKTVITLKNHKLNF